MHRLALQRVLTLLVQIEEVASATERSHLTDAARCMTIMRLAKEARTQLRNTLDQLEQRKP